MRETSRRSKRVNEWCRCGKCGVMHINVECLNYHDSEALRYFQLFNMRYNDRNAVTEEVSTTVLQLYSVHLHKF